MRSRIRAVSAMKDWSEEVIKKDENLKFGGICERKTNTRNYNKKHDTNLRRRVAQKVKFILWKEQGFGLAQK